MSKGGAGRRLIVFAAVLGVLALPAAAVAHLERPSYWPDPAPDASVQTAAGGKVPDLRSLGSAVSGKGAGEARSSARGAAAGSP